MGSENSAPSDKEWEYKKALAVSLFLNFYCPEILTQSMCLQIIVNKLQKS